MPFLLEHLTVHLMYLRRKNRANKIMDMITGTRNVGDRNTSFTLLPICLQVVPFTLPPFFILDRYFIEKRLSRSIYKFFLCWLRLRTLSISRAATVYYLAELFWHEMLEIASNKNIFFNEKLIFYTLLFMYKTDGKIVLIVSLNFAMIQKFLYSN